MKEGGRVDGIKGGHLEGKKEEKVEFILNVEGSVI